MKKTDNLPKVTFIRVERDGKDTYLIADVSAEDVTLGECIIGEYHLVKTWRSKPTVVLEEVKRGAQRS